MSSVWRSRTGLGLSVTRTVGRPRVAIRASLTRSTRGTENSFHNLRSGALELFDRGDVLHVHLGIATDSAEPLR